MKVTSGWGFPSIPGRRKAFLSPFANFVVLRFGSAETAREWYALPRLPSHQANSAELDEEPPSHRRRRPLALIRVDDSWHGYYQGSRDRRSALMRDGCTPKRAAKAVLKEAV